MSKQIPPQSELGRSGAKSGSRWMARRSSRLFANGLVMIFLGVWIMAIMMIFSEKSVWPEASVANPNDKTAVEELTVRWFVLIVIATTYTIGSVLLVSGCVIRAFWSDR